MVVRWPILLREIFIFISLRICLLMFAGVMAFFSCRNISVNFGVFSLDVFSFRDLCADSCAAVTFFP